MEKLMMEYYSFFACVKSRSDFTHSPNAPSQVTHTDRQAGSRAARAKAETRAWPPSPVRPTGHWGGGL